MGESATTDGWALAAARAASDKGGLDTVVLDVSEVLAITGWFVITSGRTDRQVRAITGAVRQGVAEAGGPKPIAVEGMDHCSWVLVNYGDVVVHVFSQEMRTFYDLERLWRDVPRLEWEPDAD